jgi:hypothetical protein
MFIYRYCCKEIVVYYNIGYYNIGFFNVGLIWGKLLLTPQRWQEYNGNSRGVKQ